MSAFTALIFGDKTSDRKLTLFCFVKVDDLSVCMSLKRSESREEINGFEHAGLALRICSRQQDNPPRDVNVQAGKVSKVREGEMSKIHTRALRRAPRRRR